MPFSTSYANKILDHVGGKTAFTMPTDLYVALSTTTPNVAGGNVTEPTSGSYARVQTSGSTWTAATGGALVNSAVVTFPTATVDWASAANFTYAVIYDAASAGNVVGFMPLSVAKSCLNGDTIQIPAGSLTITLS